MSEQGRTYGDDGIPKVHLTDDANPGVTISPATAAKQDDIILALGDVGTAIEPVDDSGQQLTATNAVTDYTATVVAGSTYRITAQTGTLYLGVDAVYAAAALVPADALVVLTAGNSENVTMPTGETTLHYGSPVAGTIGHLGKLA